LHKTTKNVSIRSSIYSKMCFGQGFGPIPTGAERLTVLP